MCRSFISFCMLMLVVLSAFWTSAQDLPIRYDFSGNSVQANGITVQGAGFGAYTQAKIFFGFLPLDNAFAGATDGQGAIIQAKPGEGIMIFFPIVATDRTALIRCSVRTDSKEASVYLASIDQGEHQFVSTITPNNGAFFLNRWKRITGFCLPPSTGFQPILQIMNNSEKEISLIYIDNFEIYVLEKERFYNEEFLNGDENDPGIISMVPDEAATSTPTPTSLPPSPTPTPIHFPGVTLTIPLPNLPAGAKPLEMMLIPAGTFTMGSPQSEIDALNEQNQTTWYSEEGPQHQVTIRKPFYIGKYEITQAQWQAVMGNNPSYFSGKSKSPVERVYWKDCQTFITQLNQLGQGTFRLPTEAEWEYACRAGTTTRFYWGDDSGYSQIGQYAWYGDNAGQTQEAGFKLPNAWGLHDMSGNVWEWCQDWYGSYSPNAQNDPTGAENGSFRVVRGGSWGNRAWDCRSAIRMALYPDASENYIGFRVARNP